MSFSVLTKEFGRFPLCILKQNSCLNSKTKILLEQELAQLVDVAVEIPRSSSQAAANKCVL